jgi:Uma2 family endonuclease
MVTQLPQTRPPLEITWEPLPADFILPDDPVENIQQPFLAAALTDALEACDRLTPEMLIASNFGLVATVNQKTIVKAPDWLYVPRVQPLSQVQPPPKGEIRRSYTPYREGDPVAVVMEYLSDEGDNEYSNRPTYPYGKFHFYEQILQVPTYVIFDPNELLLEVRYLQGGRYVSQPANHQGRYWIPELQLFLGTWYGLRVGITTHWLRWWNADGNLLLWHSEKAEQEAARAKQEAARAEQEAARAEQEAARAEQEAARAEQEAARAEQEAARAEQEAARADAAEAELARLRALLQNQPSPEDL